MVNTFHMSTAYRSSTPPGTVRRTVGLFGAFAVVIGFWGCGKGKEAPAPGGVEGPKATPVPKGPIKVKVGAERTIKTTLDFGKNLKEPRSVAVDKNGAVFVADSAANKIFKFDATGKQVGEFGRPGSEPGGFKMVWALAIDGQGDVAALDSDTAFVSVFHPDGKFVKRYLGADSHLYAPRGLAVAPDGTFYIVDTGGSRLVHYSTEWKQVGVISGPFNQPTDGAIGPSGDIYVLQPAENSTALLKKVDANGDVKGEWFATNFQSTRDTARTLVTPDGKILLTDPLNGRLVLMNADGASATPIAFEGMESPFHRWTGIAQDGKGQYFVGDLTAKVVHRFGL